MNLEQILKKLAAKIQRDGLRQTGRDFDMKPNTLHNYVKGNRVPTGKNMLKLIKKLS